MDKDNKASNKIIIAVIAVFLILILFVIGFTAVKIFNNNNSAYLSYESRITVITNSAVTDSESTFSSDSFYIGKTEETASGEYFNTSIGDQSSETEPASHTATEAEGDYADDIFNDYPENQTQITSEQIESNKQDFQNSSANITASFETLPIESSETDEYTSMY